jgi:methionyl-tRNA formyltransferase
MTAHPAPSILFISACNPGGALLANTLNGIARSLVVLAPRWVPSPAKQQSGQSLGKRIGRRINEYYRDWVLSRMTSSLREQLGTASTLDEGIPVAELPVTLINDRATIGRFKVQPPDFIITCGAPILGPEWLSLARIAAINVHLGIAPQFRGEHSILWPLLQGRFSEIGVTLHHLAPRVDAGRIVARGYPAITSSDTENTLLAKCYGLAAELLTELIAAANSAGMPEGRHFPVERGVLVRYSDRTIMTAIKGAWASIVRPIIAMPERIERFYTEFPRP